MIKLKLSLVAILALSSLVTISVAALAKPPGGSTFREACEDWYAPDADKVRDCVFLNCALIHTTTPGLQACMTNGGY